MSAHQSRTTQEYADEDLIRLALKGLGETQPNEAELVVRARDLRRGQHNRSVILRVTFDGQPVKETSIRTLGPTSRRKPVKTSKRRRAA